MSRRNQQGSVPFGKESVGGPPVLTATAGNQPWTFVASGPAPPLWNLYVSVDSGATWSEDDQNPYGTQSFDTITSGVWVSALRADSLGNGFGLRSNIIIAV